MNKRLKKKKYRDLIVKLFEEMDKRIDNIMLVKIDGQYKILNYSYIEVQNDYASDLPPKIYITTNVISNKNLNDLLKQSFDMKNRVLNIEEFIIR